MGCLFTIFYKVQRNPKERAKLPQNEFNYSSFCIATLRGSWTCPFPQEKGGSGSSDSDCVLAVSLLSSGMVADAKSPLSVFPEQ